MRILLAATIFLLISCTDSTTRPPSPPGTAANLTEAAQTPKTWFWIGNNNMFSRDGTTTGYLASINPSSDKLLVYLQGGGACYNATTCNGNDNHFDEAEGVNLANAGNSNALTLFSRNNPVNSYTDWSYVFVPYSTGDVHSGSNADADVPNGGPADQHMTGYDNFTVIANALRAYFGANGLSEIMVTGSSAGGYGTYLNFAQMADRFPGAQMTGLIDAGPMLLDDVVFDDCLANVWDNLFQFAYPADYDTIVTGTYDQRVQGIYEYLSKKYPNAHFGLMCDTRDAVIRSFFAFGKNGCNGTQGTITGAEFDNALDEVQQHLTTLNNWNVYYVNSTNHTFLANRYTGINVNGVNMATWMDDLRAGNASDVLP